MTDLYILYRGREREAHDLSITGWKFDVEDSCFYRNKATHPDSPYHKRATIAHEHWYAAIFQRDPFDLFHEYAWQARVMTRDEYDAWINRDFKTMQLTEASYAERNKRSDRSSGE